MIGFINLNFPTVGVQVNGQKVFSIFQTIQGTINMGQWVDIFFGYFIQSAVVNTETPTTVFHLYQDDWTF